MHRYGLHAEHSAGVSAESSRIDSTRCTESSRVYLVWSYLVASETGRFAIRVALATFWSLWGADLLTCLVFSEYFFVFAPFLFYA